MYSIHQQQYHLEPRKREYERPSTILIVKKKTIYCSVLEHRHLAVLLLLFSTDWKQLRCCRLTPLSSSSWPVALSKSPVLQNPSVTPAGHVELLGIIVCCLCSEGHDWTGDRAKPTCFQRLLGAVSERFTPEKRRDRAGLQMEQWTYYHMHDRQRSERPSTKKNSRVHGVLRSGPTAQHAPSWRFNLATTQQTAAAILVLESSSTTRKRGGSSSNNNNNKPRTITRSHRTGVVWNCHGIQIHRSV